MLICQAISRFASSPLNCATWLSAVYLKRPGPGACDVTAGQRQRPWGHSSAECTDVRASRGGGLPWGLADFAPNLSCPNFAVIKNVAKKKKKKTVVTLPVWLTNTQPPASCRGQTGDIVCTRAPEVFEKKIEKQQDRRSVPGCLSGGPTRWLWPIRTPKLRLVLTPRTPKTGGGVRGPSARPSMTRARGSRLLH